MTTYPQSRLLDIYRQHMRPAVDPDAVTLIRWADRIDTLAQLRVSHRDWTREEAGSLVDEVNELMRLWRDEMPTWVVETPCNDGTVLSRHTQAPTYEQAVQLFD
jgi:hypothetical protein